MPYIFNVFSGEFDYYQASTGGTVTSVTGTLPIVVVNSTTTPVISITQATTSTDGYLSATDWNTFNNKQPAGNYITALTGEGTASGPGSVSLTLSNAAVIGKVLTGYVSGAGTVAATDTILQAIQKLNGNTAALVTGVSSVSGTTNRITSSPTTGAVVVDISASYIGQTSITTLGTITTGTWNAFPVEVTYGGTGANLSATGGVSQVLQQTSVGGAVTVAQLAASDLSNGTLGSGAVVLGTNSTITTANLIKPSFQSSSSIFATSLITNMCDGRLTLTSATPVTTSDVTAATTIYFTPYKGNRLALYDGSIWGLYLFSELSVAVPSTLFKLFDIFVYDNSGTLTLETADWNQSTGSITGASAASPCVITSNGHGLSNGDMVGIAGIVGSLGTDVTNGINGKTWTVSGVLTNTFNLDGSSTGGLTYTSGGTWYKIPNTRATALTTQNGVLVKSGAPTRRYLGTAMTTGTSGQTQDSVTKRYLWNYNNRARTYMYHNTVAGAETWTYGSAAWRYANLNAVNRVELINGYQEDIITVKSCSLVIAGTAGVYGTVGIGENRNTNFDHQLNGRAGDSATQMPSPAFLQKYPGLGYSYYAHIEYVEGGTVTYGSSLGNGRFQAGISADWYK